MVTQRTEGLYRLFLLCQIVLVALLFWFGVWIMITFQSGGGELTWRRYSVYCVVLVLGLTMESLVRDGSKNYFLQNDRAPASAESPIAHHPRGLDQYIQALLHPQVTRVNREKPSLGKPFVRRKAPRSGSA